MEGPRAVRIHEMPSLARLVDAVFVGGAEGAMFRCYPQLFNERNIKNCLVFIDNGTVVSHVGMVQVHACIEGCTLKVACIGSVSTYEPYRAKGLASQLFQAACDKAVADGVDFMMISGGRGLYRRVGAADVGCDFMAVVERAGSKALAARGVTIEPLGPADLDACADAYNRRPARFLRPREDWQRLLQSDFTQCRNAELLVVKKRGIFRGYFILEKQDKEGVAQAVEFAGDEIDLAAALKPLLQKRKSRAIHLRLQTGDHVLRELLKSIDIALRCVSTTGTLLILNFPQLMMRLQPYFAARVGTESAASLAFRQEGGRFVFAAPGEECVMDCAGAAQIVFGHPDRGPLPGLLGQVFPVPSLWYGMNYI